MVSDAAPMQRMELSLLTRMRACSSSFIVAASHMPPHVPALGVPRAEPESGEDGDDETLAAPSAAHSRHGSVVTFGGRHSRADSVASGTGSDGPPPPGHHRRMSSSGRAGFRRRDSRGAFAARRHSRKFSTDSIDTSAGRQRRRQQCAWRGRGAGTDR